MSARWSFNLEKEETVVKEKNSETIIGTVINNNAVKYHIPYNYIVKPVFLFENQIFYLKKYFLKICILNIGFERKKENIIIINYICKYM